MADRRVLSQINVTPFVDVILVLLVIFMITAPMMQEGVEVDLPKTTSQAIKTPSEPVIVSVDRKGVVYINNKKYAKNKIESKLRAVFKRRSDKEVLLKADRSVKYGEVVKVMASIRRAGVEKIGMITEGGADVNRKK